MHVVYITTTRFTFSLLHRLRKNTEGLQALSLHLQECDFRRIIPEPQSQLRCTNCGADAHELEPTYRSHYPQLYCPHKYHLREFLYRQSQRTWDDQVTNPMFHNHVHLLAKAFSSLLRNTEIRVIRMRAPAYYQTSDDIRQSWPEDGLLYELVDNYVASVKCMAVQEGYTHVESIIKRAIRRSKKTSKNDTRLPDEEGEDHDANDNDGDVTFIPWTERDRLCPPQWNGHTVNCIPESNLSALPVEMLPGTPERLGSFGTVTGTDDEWVM